MIEVTAYQGATVGVMGLGKSGLSALRALLAGGAKVRAWDDRESARDQAKLLGAELDPLTDAGPLSALVLSPGIPHTFPEPHPVAQAAKLANVPIVGDVGLLAMAKPNNPLVGITGTNGKSTTTALLGHILGTAGDEIAVGGNLGTPVLDLPALSSDGVYVLEMSSYQLELSAPAVFSIAVLLNITPDHLGRHGGMEGYIAAKRRIFEAQVPGHLSICGIDDPICLGIYDQMVTNRRTRVVPVSGQRFVPGGVYVEAGWLCDDRLGRRQPIIDMAKVPALAGKHNFQNAAAAAAAALGLEVSIKRIAKALQSFPGLAHRQEKVGEFEGVTFINDSKATNAEAASKALTSYPAIYWIAGGKPKEGGLECLESELNSVRKAFLIGEAGPAFQKALDGKIPAVLSGDLKTATAQAFAEARAEPGSVVLLSPACASFDQFANFEARGDAFRDIVKALAEEVRP